MSTSVWYKEQIAQILHTVYNIFTQNKKSIKRKKRKKKNAKCLTIELLINVIMSADITNGKEARDCFPYILYKEELK